MAGHAKTERTPAEQREIKALVRSGLANGWHEEQVVNETKLTLKDVRWAKYHILKEESAAASGLSPTEQWALYKLRTDGCIVDLNRVIESCLGGPNGAPAGVSASAATGAIKAKADIIEKQMAKGQEMGLIIKAPTRVEVVAGINVMTLPMEELQTQIYRYQRETRAMMDATAGNLADPMADPGNVYDAVNTILVPMRSSPAPFRPQRVKALSSPEA